MKNLHVLPTDKPSRLLYFGTSKELTLQVNPATFRVFERNTQHIYITSDEEIKEDDWVIYNNKVFKIGRGDNELFHLSKKIILTTDQDLIKDGVQSIDDEFLEWFVENPSCEFVPIIITTINNESLYKTNIGFESWRKEVQKQHLIDIMRGDEELGLYEEPKQEKPVQVKGGDNVIFPSSTTITFKPKQENCCTPIGQIKRYLNCVGCDRTLKQETLEEAAEKYHKKISKKRNTQLGIPSQDFEAGAKYQAKRMYSEEELKRICSKAWLKTPNTPNMLEEFDKWFEQFKKK
jgi:hypothetical protein